MRNMLAFCAALTLTVAFVGYHLGWFKVASAPGAMGHRSVSVDINTVKVERDLEKGASKIERMIEKTENGAGSGAAQTDGAVLPQLQPAQGTQTIPQMIDQGTKLQSPY